MSQPDSKGPPSVLVYVNGMPTAVPIASEEGRRLAVLDRGAPTPDTLHLAQLEHTWGRVVQAMRQGTPPARYEPWLTLPGVVVPEAHREAVAARLGRAGWAVRWLRHGAAIIADRQKVDGGHGG